MEWQPIAKDKSGDGAAVIVKQVKADHIGVGLTLPRPVHSTQEVSISLTRQEALAMSERLDAFLKETR